MKKTRRYARVILLTTLAMLMLLLSGCATETQNENGIFAGGAFDEEGIWVAKSEEYGELIAELGEKCKKYATGSVMLATDEQVLFSGGWRATETDGETTVGEMTTYEIGSVTKQFTAAAILQQVEQGKLSVSETIDKYFPQLPFGEQVTIDNLLHMDSGIVDYVGNANAFFGGDTEAIEQFSSGAMSDESILDYMSQTELSFTPGSSYSYSNTNYYLLALILEQVSGKTYEEYIRENIFDVCSMDDSTCCEVGNITSVPKGPGYMPTARCSRGAGDIHSSTHDLLLWDRALMGGKVLEEEQLRYMTQFREGYGCGWMDLGDGHFYHGGSTGSYLTQNYVFTTKTGERLYLLIMCPDMKKGYSVRFLTEPVMDYVGYVQK